jgi:tetratricopeptide (TPR) repeat protein
MIVTSRYRFELAGLKKDIDKMSPRDARDLILTITTKTAPRVQQHADAFAQLCDYLPEALRATARAIAERPNLDPQNFLRNMSDTKERFKITGVELSLKTSSDLLEAELRNRWFLLSVFPDTFDCSAAGTIWDCAPCAAETALGDLLRYSLVEWNSVTNRYRLHDLARDFTTLQLDDATRAAQGRHAEHYKNVLDAADELYLKGGASILEGLALFDLEWSNIQAGQAWAASHSEQDRSAAQLCVAYPDAGVHVLGLRQPPRERIRWLDAALNSARKLVDRVHEGSASGSLGIAYHSLGDYRRAIEFYEQALTIWREIGDRLGESKALGNLGNAHHSLGDYPRAIEFHGQHLAIARELGDRQGEGIALGNLGNAHYSMGEYRRAIELHEQQRAIAHEIGDRLGEGNTLWNSALTLNKLGDLAEAIRRAEQALVIFEQIESPAAEQVRNQLASWRKPS